MSCNECYRLIHFLHDTIHVTRFQQCFGLQIVNSDQKQIKENGFHHPSRKIQIGASNKRYIINNYFWYYLFSFGSKLGYELFYAFSFSYCYWNLDSLMCRRLMLVWAILMYIGQALKDIIKWPRPDGPNVLVLEPQYSMEYGMPSTHAMLALMVPINLFFIILNRYEFSLFIFISAALFWCLLICCSRLYLGMHSVLDIIAGLILTAIILVPLLPAIETIDQFLLKNPSSPIVFAIVVLILGLIYPKSNNLSPSRGDTCTIISSTAGVYIGSWLNYQLGIIRQVTLVMPFQINYPPIEEVPIVIIRTFLGLLIVAFFRFASKQIIIFILKLIYNIDPNSPKTKHITMVEVPTKLFTYAGLGFSISFVSPFIFQMLNIFRTSMHYEAS